ncbi:hypothetical protein [Undibacterium sp. RuTC16W]|uniref:hypothetical protein n=1 Tax=Undibacterium sp. RuTC16W TaxID=3413048 RepID=UPI003BF065AA
MEVKLLKESTSFFGTLSKDNHKIELDFSVCVEISGEASISIDRFPLNESTKFVLENFENGGTHFKEFSLDGISTDGTTFKCDDLIFTSLGNLLLDGTNTICPSAHYSFARMKLVSECMTSPVLSWRIKGFQCLRSLVADTDLGRVEMLGLKDADGKNEVSGYIKVVASHIPEDLDVWRASSTKLCDHIRHVMSFAANADLEYPVIEFSNKERVEIELYSRGEQKKSVWPPFNWLSLQGIFQCAVRNYFQPVFEVKNLFFAIQWFNMHGSYREANLISSMTVLENLIDSNLSDQDSFLLGARTYEMLRRKLSKVVKEEVKTWTENEEEQRKVIAELNNRFSDLKRRSLLEKLNLLAKRWGVRLEDIEVKRINEAKAARDQVVHQGHYEPSPEVTGDLHDHVLVVRELVVRFILTALNFEGTYCSFVNGQNAREFSKNDPMLDFRLTITP